MQQLQPYLPVQVQEALPVLQDYLIKIQIEKYLTLANTLKAIGAISASYVAFKVAKILAIRRKYAHIPGPETKGLFQFFAGNMPTLGHMERLNKIPADYMLEWHKKYGPVVKFQILDNILVSTIDPESIKEALIVKNFPKSMLFFEAVKRPLNIRLADKGLVTEPDNTVWRGTRSILNPAFHRNALKDSVNEFNAKSDILMEKLRTLADGKTSFRLFTEINHATLDVIASIAFGMNLDTINNEKDRIFNDQIATMMAIIGDFFKNPLSKYSPFMPLKAYKLRKIVKFLRETGKQKILERLNDKSGAAEQNDILAGIINSSKPSELDLELMMDNFLTFFIAGQETTSNTLAFSFMEIGRSRQIFEKCRQEVDDVLGMRNEITFEDVSKLKYVGSVFKEALRMYPPATSISRIAPEDIMINGLKIPKDTNLNFPQYVSGRNEAFFPNPLEFRPERFLKDANSMESSVPSYAYYPFSLGPRNCIGQQFAQIEGIIILAKFIQSFDFKLAPGQSFDYIQDVTLKPKDGVQIVLSLRK